MFHFKDTNSRLSFFPSLKTLSLKKIWRHPSNLETCHSSGENVKMFAKKIMMLNSKILSPCDFSRHSHDVLIRWWSSSDKVGLFSLTISSQVIVRHEGKWGKKVMRARSSSLLLARFFFFLFYELFVCILVFASTTSDRKKKVWLLFPFPRKIIELVPGKDLD